MRSRKLKHVAPGETVTPPIAGGALPIHPPEHDPVTSHLRKGPHRKARRGSFLSQPSTRLTDPGLARGAAQSDNALAIFGSADLTSAIGNADDGWEDSQARAGNVVFYTFNWGAAYSVDGGRSFTRVDAAAGFDGLPAGEGFCCDQEVIYAPAIDRFIWVRQTGQATASGENRYRIAVASPSEFTSSSAPTWKTFDLTPGTFGLSGKQWWFDYDGLSVGTQSAFMSFNVVGSGRSMVVRLPFKALTGSGGLSGAYFFPEGIANFRVAQNIGTRAYFAAQKSTSELRSFYWDEGTLTVYYRDVGISSVPTKFGSQLPDGSDWLAPSSKVSERITGATRVGNQVWYAWTGGVDKTFPQPHIEIAKINVPSLTLAGERYIASRDFAWAYPDLATNQRGDVAIAYSWGGGVYAVRTGIGFLNGRQDLVNTSDPGEGGGGHYLTLHRDWPNKQLFTVGNYWQPFADASKTSRVNHPQFIVFGRSGDGGGLRPVFPLYRPNLVISQLTRSTFTVLNEGRRGAGHFVVNLTNSSLSPQYSRDFEFTNLAPGASVTASYDYQCQGIVTAAVDVNNEVDEPDENDNSRTERFFSCIT